MLHTSLVPGGKEARDSDFGEHFVQRSLLSDPVNVEKTFYSLEGLNGILKIEISVVIIA